ncbi:MAG: membrane protein insertase YidC [Deltaproteobacteria bacterium]|nr:membrane protein insertase YidC [Candidatus Anaeroferrophillus wilburensis]MBN2889173.1 membrane protein insertase YidC [Deltaproteobacteria bacterium]
MEKRTILAVALSLAVLLGWQFIFPPAKKTPPAPVEVVAEQAKPDVADDLTKVLPAGSSASPLAAGAGSVPASSGREVTIETPAYQCVIDTAGGVVKKFTLQHYQESVSPTSARLEMATVVDPAYYPLAGTLSLGDQQFSDRRFVYQPAAGVSGQLEVIDRQQELVLTHPLPNGQQVVKKYVFYPGEYYFDLFYELRASDGSPAALATTSLAWSHELFESAAKEKTYVYSGPLAYVNGKLFKQSKKQKNIKKMELDGTVSWIGYTTKYFMAAIMPLHPESSGRSVGAIEKPSMHIVETGLQLDGAGQFRVFVGPKETSYLKTLGQNLEKSVDFGWFGVIARPLVQLLNLFYRYVHNYGVAIILVTILIKLVFYPLSQKSYQSMGKMKEVQPKLAKLKEKFKDDKARQQKEMMDLYRTHKVNPFGGCLPMVAQIPVFFGLYRGLMVAIELRHAPFFWWIQDLAAKDPYYVTPILMGATMLLQQKMTPSTGDQMQAKMMMFMPIIFTFMFLSFPAGLVLYWLVNNLLSIGQQYMVMKKATVK